METLSLWSLVELRPRAAAHKLAIAKKREVAKLTPSGPATRLAFIHF